MPVCLSYQERSARNKINQLIIEPITQSINQTLILDITGLRFHVHQHCTLSKFPHNGVYSVSKGETNLSRVFVTVNMLTHFLRIKERKNKNK